MTLMLSVSGCRGVVGESLTPEVATRYAGAFAAFVRSTSAGKPVTVVLGRDGRAGGNMLHHAALTGLLASGAHVVDVGIAMTPTVAVATDRFATDNPNDAVAGMVLTASHNPQQWNGLKCLLRSGPGAGADGGVSAAAPPAALAAQIIGRFERRELDLVGWDRLGGVSDAEGAAGLHVERVLGALSDGGFGEPFAIGAELGVVVDSVNASGVAGAAALMEVLGVSEFLHLGAEDTGIFPHPPEPTEENLGGAGGLCDAVREHQADVGFAQDPDADRLAIVDEKGRYIGEEYTLALSALAILSAMKKSGAATEGRVFATNLSTSRMLDDVCAGFGARVVRTPVGEANVVEAMKREHALGGGEGNGGIIWPRTTYVRDSLTAMSLVMWLIRSRREPLSRIVASVPSYAIRKRKVALGRKEDAVGAVERVAAAFSGERVDRSDGAWVDLASRRSWLHVRASNTEPIMRLIAEAPTVEEADRLLDSAAGAMA
ncbi:MAG: phosphoglucosamine mutase [Phycisphaerales bacterium]